MTDLAQTLTDRAVDATGNRRRGRPPAGRILTVLIPLVVLAVLIFLPWLGFSIPGVLPGPVNSPGSMQLLALCLVTGRHRAQLRRAVRSYRPAVVRPCAVRRRRAPTRRRSRWASWAPVWWPRCCWLLVTGIVLPLLVGAISLRVKGIAFAMVTLAFAQAVAITALRNPGGSHRRRGGPVAEPVGATVDPVRVCSTRPTGTGWRWPSALGVLVVVEWLTTARTGHAWAAVRENEDRVEVLGLSAYRTKLPAVVVGGFLGTLGGFVQLIIAAGPTRTCCPPSSPCPCW